jgi:acetylornithine deacetylase
MSIDQNATLKLLEELVTIDSVNPSLVRGASGEQRAAEHVQKFLRAHEIAAELEEVAPRRPNVVAHIGSSNAKPALMLVAHIDTVGAGDMREPFTPRVRDGKLYGRGALDIKSGVAAMCAAAVSVAHDVASGVLRLARPFMIAAVADEECNSIGTQELLRRGRSAEFAIVLEPTDLQLVVAHKGYAWFEIVTHGRAAHGSLPSEGRDAVRMMGRVLVALDELEKKLTARAPHPRLGNASLHASLIEGGQELSSYPAECRLQLERRMLPGETEASVETELREMLEALEDASKKAGGHATGKNAGEENVAAFRATLRSGLGSRPAYEIDEGSALVKRASAAVRRACGQCELAGMAAWTDTALLVAASIPGIVFGPSGRGLHGAEEYVEIESVHKCAAALRELILEFCG